MKNRALSATKKRSLVYVATVLLLIFIWWSFSPSASSDFNMLDTEDSAGNRFYQIPKDKSVGEQTESAEGQKILPPVRQHDPAKPRYMAIIPGFGPNNQYLGLKDMMYIAKLIGRTLARPDFFTHAIDHLNSIRPYEKTFNTETISEYAPTISLKEYAERCENVIDTIVWGRGVNEWRRVVDLWLEHTGMTSASEATVTRDVFLPSPHAITSYFDKFKNSRCIAFAFPFRNIPENKERKSLSRYLTRADWLKRVGDQEMGAENFLAIHWRWGEDSCGWYKSPSPHEDYDFCWGTSTSVGFVAPSLFCSSSTLLVFHYARLDSIFASLKKVIEEKHVSAVYLAVSLAYHDKVVLQKISDFMKESNVKLFIGQQSLTSLKNITDNYYLSLIEQEICDRATTFVWSSDSTWSDFIVDHNAIVGGKLETISFAKLLDRNGHPFTTWNRERDVQQLRKTPRSSVIQA